MAVKKLDLVTWLKNWFESKTNKVTSLSSNSTDTEYPTAKAVYDAIQNSGGCVEDYYFDSTTKEIVIDYVCGSESGGSGGSVVIDDSWITDSTNPVQSKIIKLALDGKAASDHTHSQYLTEHQSLTNYVQKSSTSGVLKNDGSVMTGGTGSTNYAIGNHTHSAYVNPTIADNLTTNDSSQVLSAKQGKILDEKIGNIITIINGTGS